MIWNHPIETTANHKTLLSGGGGVSTVECLEPLENNSRSQGLEADGRIKVTSKVPKEASRLKEAGRKLNPCVCGDGIVVFRGKGRGEFGYCLGVDFLRLSWDGVFFVWGDDFGKKDIFGYYFDWGEGGDIVQLAGMVRVFAFFRRGHEFNVHDQNWPGSRSCSSHRVDSGLL